MNRLCEYCGINPIAENYNSTCEFCIYQCSTCHADTPYEDGVSNSSECGVCDLGTGAASLEIRIDADMNFIIQGITTGYRNGYAYPETDTTTTQQGDKNMSNKLFTVIGFDDATEQYEVVGTTTSDITGEDLIDLLSKGDETTEFEKVIADLHNYQVAEMASMVQSRVRASRTGMTKADHTPIVMRKGEWRSMVFALEQLQKHDDIVMPASQAIAYGVSYQTLIDIINAQGVA